LRTVGIKWSVVASIWRLMRKVVPIRGSVEEHARWKEAAELSGLVFSPWARMRLNEAADAELAEQRERDLVVRDRERLRQLVAPGRER
jgi:hypothetical protein